MVTIRKFGGTLALQDDQRNMFFLLTSFKNLYKWNVTCSFACVKTCELWYAAPIDKYFHECTTQTTSVFTTEVTISPVHWSIRQGTVSKDIWKAPSSAACPPRQRTCWCNPLKRKKKNAAIKRGIPIELKISVILPQGVR